jgi:hypothetical protein
VAPPRKVPPGSVTRSILFRADQLAALEAAADWAAADVSDVLRAVVDLLLPSAAAAVWARTRAGFELRRRALLARPDLLQAVEEGWRGLDPRLPLAAADRDTARRVGEAVGMLRRLCQNVKQKDRTPRWVENQWRAFAGDWAGRAVDPLLAVLACPAALCHVAPGRADGRPDLVTVADVAARTDGAAERQYEGVGVALAACVEAAVLVAPPPPQGPPVPWPATTYRVAWDRAEHPPAAHADPA